MVIGYDAWADKSGATLKNKVSIGAVVCTTNHTQTTFLSFAVRHSNQVIFLPSLVSSYCPDIG